MAGHPALFFANVQLSPRPAGEGRVVHDEFSIITARPSSYPAILANMGQHNSHIQQYGVGNAPGVGGIPFSTIRYQVNQQEPHYSWWLRRRSIFASMLGGPLGTPLPIIAASVGTTPLVPIQRREELPNQFYGRWSRARLGHFIAQAQLDADLGRNAFIPNTEAMDTISPDYATFMSVLKERLLEPPVQYDNMAVWQLWTEDEILDNINRRAGRFCLETGITKEMREVVYNTVANPVPTDGIFLMPNDCLDLRRVAWKDEDGVVTKLELMDEHSLTFGVSPQWRDLAGDPLYYTVEGEGALGQFGQIRLVPRPILVSSTPVSLILHMVANPTLTFQGGQGALARIPEVFIPYVRWGVLADLLQKQGEANDPERAAYCEQRFDEGIEVAKAMLGRVI